VYTLYSDSLHAHDVVKEVLTDFSEKEKDLLEVPIFTELMEI
jgi:hypothetical protein